MPRVKRAATCRSLRRGQSRLPSDGRSGASPATARGWPHLAPLLHANLIHCGPLRLPPFTAISLVIFVLRRHYFVVAPSKSKPTQLLLPSPWSDGWDARAMRHPEQSIVYTHTSLTFWGVRMRRGGLQQKYILQCCCCFIKFCECRHTRI